MIGDIITRPRAALNARHADAARVSDAVFKNPSRALVVGGTCMAPRPGNVKRSPRYE